MPTYIGVIRLVMSCVGGDRYTSWLPRTVTTTTICIIKPYLAPATDTCCWSSIRAHPFHQMRTMWLRLSWQLETVSSGRTDLQDGGRGRMIERSRKRLVHLRTEAVTYWSSRRFEAKKGMESDVTLQKPSLQLKTCTIDFVIANSYQCHCVVFTGRKKYL